MSKSQRITNGETLFTRFLLVILLCGIWCAADWAAPTPQDAVAGGQAPLLQSALSIMPHGSAGEWPVDVGSGNVESRSLQLGTTNPNELLILATFDIDVSLLCQNCVFTDVGTITSVTIDPADNRVVEIALTDLPFWTQLTLTFWGVTDASNPIPAYASHSTLCITVVVGDYDNNGRTNWIDAAKLVRDRDLPPSDPSHVDPNEPVDCCNEARADFNCCGRPNSLDWAQIRAAGLINKGFTAAARCDPFIDP